MLPSLSVTYSKVADEGHTAFEAENKVSSVSPEIEQESRGLRYLLN